VVVWIFYWSKYKCQKTGMELWLVERLKFLVLSGIQIICLALLTHCECGVLSAENRTNQRQIKMQVNISLALKNSLYSTLIKMRKLRSHWILEIRKLRIIWLVSNSQVRHLGSDGESRLINMHISIDFLDYYSAFNHADHSFMSLFMFSWIFSFLTVLFYLNLKSNVTTTKNIWIFK
jgi:hypothetical protein